MIVAYEQIIYVFLLSKPIRLSWKCQSLQLHSEISPSVQFSFQLFLALTFSMRPISFHLAKRRYSQDLQPLPCWEWSDKKCFGKCSTKAHLRQEHTPVYVAIE